MAQCVRNCLWHLRHGFYLLSGLIFSMDWLHICGIPTAKLEGRYVCIHFPPLLIRYYVAICPLLIISDAGTCCSLSNACEAASSSKRDRIRKRDRRTEGQTVHSIALCPHSIVRVHIKTWTASSATPEDSRWRVIDIVVDDASDRITTVSPVHVVRKPPRWWQVIEWSSGYDVVMVFHFPVG